MNKANFRVLLELDGCCYRLGGVIKAVLFYLVAVAVSTL